MEPVGHVAALYRYPVKSMLGEQLASVQLGDRGLSGDRAYAVVDRRDGRVATGKHPRKWSQLVQLAAAFVDEPAAGEVPPVAITFPDGSSVRSDSADVDARLSAFLGREVTLVRGAGEGQTIEEVWPSIEGLAPDDLVEAMSGGRREGGDRISDIPVSSMAPAGTFFDLTTLHVITGATLRRLSELAPDADFDVRRYRPNVLIDGGAEGGFPENGWTGSTLSLGSAAARVDLPTMRCVMTTLARDGMAADPGSLRAIAKHNRVDILGMGRWACAGAYASVTTAGAVTVGDPVAVA